MSAAHIKEIKFLLNMASAIFGITGTWMMSRRYAKQFGRSILFACIAPLLFVFGRGERVREFINAKITGNKDLPDSASEMALGLALLFLAFVLQLGCAFVDLLG